MSIQDAVNESGDKTIRRPQRPAGRNGEETRTVNRDKDSGIDKAKTPRIKFARVLIFDLVATVAVTDDHGKEYRITESELVNDILHGRRILETRQCRKYSHITKIE